MNPEKLQARFRPEPEQVSIPDLQTNVHRLYGKLTTDLGAKSALRFRQDTQDLLTSPDLNYRLLVLLAPHHVNDAGVAITIRHKPLLTLENVPTGHSFLVGARQQLFSVDRAASTVELEKYGASFVVDPDDEGYQFLFSTVSPLEDQNPQRAALDLELQQLDEINETLTTFPQAFFIDIPDDSQCAPTVYAIMLPTPPDVYPN